MLIVTFFFAACDSQISSFVENAKRGIPPMNAPAAQAPPQRTLSDQLTNGYSSKDSLSTVSIDLNGLVAGDTVKVYTDAACSQLVGTVTAAGSSATVLATVSANQLYNFYFAVTDTNALTTGCMAGTSSYRKIIGFTVDTTANPNTDDANINDSICATAGGVCTLKAAISSAMAQSATQEVLVKVPDGTYVVTATLHIPMTGVTNPITIRGGTNTIIDGGNSVSPIRIYGTPSGSGSMLLEKLTIQNGRMIGGSGGGIQISFFSGSASNRATVKDCVIKGNWAEDRGGGIYILLSSYVNIENTEFFNNDLSNSGLYGLAIYTSNSNNVNLKGLYVHDHNTNPTGAAGIVAIEYSLNITSENFSLVNNTSNRTVLYVYDCNNCPLKNSTIANNNGRGISNSAPSNHAIVMQNLTLVDNWLASPAGNGRNLDITGFGANVTLTNSILYSSSGTGVGASITTTGTRTSAGNIINDASHGFASGVTNINPDLSTLASNGGFGLSMLPNVSSPAKNAGDNLYCPLKDQRGNSRPGNSTNICDIGAIEL